MGDEDRADWLIGEGRVLGLSAGVINAAFAFAKPQSPFEVADSRLGNIQLMFDVSHQ
jgi:hypothetical protein